MSDLASEPRGIPKAQPGASMEDWVASWFFEHDGGIWCRVCGCKILDGWQQDHYESAHGFRGF